MTTDADDGAIQGDQPVATQLPRGSNTGSVGFRALLAEARGILSELRAAAMMQSRAADGTCALFYRDRVIYAALPWADVDAFQRRLLASRAPDDDLLLTQLIDLIPSLAGRALVDIGSFTGSAGFFLRALMGPDATHIFEPQSVMQESLTAAILRNSVSGGPIHFHSDILGEDGQEIEIGTSTPVRLYQTRYLHRSGGGLRARALDSFDLGKVGLINLDFYNDKVSVLRGALGVIERDHPAIVMDLTARDVINVRELLSPLGYRDIRVGRNSMLMLPA